ncbi:MULTISPECIES: hypothetical protein [Cryobacterium]|nr:MULTISPECIES: hypothetical protein [Cryobacterium]
MDVADGAQARERAGQGHPLGFDRTVDLLVRHHATIMSVVLLVIGAALI